MKQQHLIPIGASKPYQIITPITLHLITAETINHPLADIYGRCLKNQLRTDPTSPPYIILIGPQQSTDLYPASRAYAYHAHFTYTGLPIHVLNKVFARFPQYGHHNTLIITSDPAVTAIKNAIPEIHIVHPSKHFTIFTANVM